MKHVFLFGIFGWLLSFTLVAQTGIWQWSVPVHNFSTHPKNPESRAYLWIPGQCEQVKAILVAQHNMELLLVGLIILLPINRNVHWHAFLSVVSGHIIVIAGYVRIFGENVTSIKFLVWKPWENMNQHIHGAMKV